MIKKHAFSPNHKVVTKSPHNFHPNGAPSTASMGAPPSELGGGPAAAPGGGMDAGGGASANFCNGGMKYADGGYTGPPSKAEMAADSVKHVLGMDRNPVQDRQAQKQQATNSSTDDAERQAVTGEDK